jgi:hypothetical protein
MQFTIFFVHDSTYYPSVKVADALKKYGIPYKELKHNCWDATRWGGPLAPSVFVVSNYGTDAEEVHQRLIGPSYRQSEYMDLNNYL